jgi:hypothetical protein
LELERDSTELNMEGGNPDLETELKVDERLTITPTVPPLIARFAFYYIRGFVLDFCTRVQKLMNRHKTTGLYNSLRQCK